MVLNGDFNKNLLKIYEIPKLYTFLENLMLANTCQLVLSPTRVTDHSSTLIENLENYDI